MKTEVFTQTSKEISRESQVFFVGTPYEVTIDQTNYENGGALVVFRKRNGFIVLSHLPPQGGDSIRPVPGGEDNPNPPILPGG